MTRSPASISLTLAVIVGAAGCGGGSSSSDTASAHAASPRQAFRCLQSAVGNVKSTSPGNQSVVSAMVVDEGKQSQVSVLFLNSEAHAKAFAAQANAQLEAAHQKARSHVFARTALLGYGPAVTSSQLDAIKGCVGS